MAKVSLVIYYTIELMIFFFSGKALYYFCLKTETLGISKYLMVFLPSPAINNTNAVQITLPHMKAGPVGLIRLHH